MQKCLELNKKPKELILTDKDYEALLDHLYDLEKVGFEAGIKVEQLTDSTIIVGWLDEPKRRRFIEFYNGMHVAIGPHTCVKAW